MYFVSANFYKGGFTSSCFGCTSSHVVNTTFFWEAKALDGHHRHFTLEKYCHTGIWNITQKSSVWKKAITK